MDERPSAVIRLCQRGALSIPHPTSTTMRRLIPFVRLTTFARAMADRLPQTPQTQPRPWYQPGRKGKGVRKGSPIRAGVNRQNAFVPNFFIEFFLGRQSLLYRPHPIPSFRSRDSVRFLLSDPFSHPSGSSGKRSVNGIVIFSGLDVVLWPSCWYRRQRKSSLPMMARFEIGEVL